MSPLPPAAPDPAPSPDPIPITGQGYLPDSVLHDVLSAVDQLGISHNFKEVSDRLLAVLGEAFHATSAFIYAFLPGAAGQGDRLGIYAEWPAAPGARLLPDWLDDPVLFAALAAGQPYFTRAFPTAAAPAALVFFPLRLNGKYWGGIGFEDSSSGKIWTPAENAMLSAAVATVCHAIERTLRPAAPGADARLVQESEQRVFAEAISHTANILNQSHDLNEVLELIMDHIGTVVPHDVANIMLVTGDTAQITATRGYDKLGVEKAVLLAQRRKIEQVPNLRRMAETGLGIVVSDTHASPDWVEFKSSAWIHSYVSAPICYKGAVIGFLNLNSSIAGFYQQIHLQRLQVFADQAATAIENARLYEYARQELAIRIRAEGELQQTLNELEVRVEQRTAELSQMNVLLKSELDRRRQAEEALREERASLAKRVAERTAELSAANAELAKTARMKDAFLANTSHELRTPLNAILNILETLQEEVYGPLNEMQARSVRTVENSTHHLLSLINDILDLSKIGAGKFDLAMDFVPADFLCSSSLELVRAAAAKKNIALSLGLDTTVRFVWADGRRLKQVLVNLLGNAVKFTQPGGEVGLKVTANPEERRVSFTVWDTGIGIPADQLQALFKPFVQLDNGLARQFEGTGLGLALVYHITSLHGGGVAVESAPGQGSRFIVSLPLRDPDEENRIAPTTGPLLSAEDALPKIVRYLSELGIETVSLGLNAETFEKISTLGPQIVLLKTSPGQASAELVRRLRQDARTQRTALMLICSAEEQESWQPLPAGVDLLQLPLTRQDFRAVLRTHTGLGTASLIRNAALITDWQALGDNDQPLLMVVDDNEGAVKFLFEHLSVRGYRLLAVHNSLEAIERARELKPNLIFLDMNLPGLDGVEALRRIHGDPLIGPVPLVAISALTRPGDRTRSLDAGANEYLSKPFHAARVLAVVETLLRPVEPGPADVSLQEE